MLFFFTSNSCVILRTGAVIEKQRVKVGEHLSTAVIVYIGMTNKHVWLSAIQLIWKYQPANDNNVTIIAKKRRGSISRYPSLSAWREMRRLIATKKREGEEEYYWTDFFQLHTTVVHMKKSDYYFLPWSSSFECFFSVNSFLLDTMILVLWYTWNCIAYNNWYAINPTKLKQTNYGI